MRKYVFLAVLMSAILNMGAVFHKVSDYETPGYVGAVLASGNIAYLSSGTELHILDVSDNSSPDLLSVLEFNCSVQYMALDGDILYTLEAGITAIDVSDPQQPIILGHSYFNDEWVTGFGVSNGYAYIANTFILEFGVLYQIQVINVSNPSHMYQVCYHELILPPLSICVSGNKVYLGDGTGLHILEFSSPHNYVTLGYYPVQGGVLDIVVDGDRAYLRGNISLRIVDVGDPTFPHLLGSLPHESGYLFDMDACENTAYLVYEDYLRAIDASDPQHPELGSLYQGSFEHVFASGGRAYLTYMPNNLTIVDVSTPENSFLLASLDTDGNAYMVLADQDMAYVADGYEGLLKVDCSDPEAPLLLGSCAIGANLRDLAKVGNHVYTACSGFTDGGLQIFDVSGPQPALLSTLNYSFDRHVEVEVIGDRAFLMIDQSLHIIDISDPAQPAQIGYFYSPGAKLSLAVAGDLAFMTSYNALRIVNVTNPQAPFLVSELALQDGKSLAVAGNAVYVTDTELGLLIIDVSYPANSAVHSTLKPHPTSRLNYCHIQGNRLIVADSAWNEISIYDVSTPLAPCLISRYAWNWDTLSLYQSGGLLFTANGIMGGIKIHDFNSIVSADDPAIPIPPPVLGNYPNPFNPSTNIVFNLAKVGRARLAVYDLRGRKTRGLLDSELSAGKHSLVWDGKASDGKEAASGVYILRLESGGISHTLRLALLK